jgi:hypothetical protein
LPDIFEAEFQAENSVAQKNLGAINQEINEVKFTRKLKEIG